ncbi:unnamed protein product [Lepeophtheirus salmonis]|uniref:(salmon louse) hypothetical protein n=1 Tax=Lepeophtheirus salmonis TaxID=72036 RepID=A0A7R8HCZ1_LEPSM|nr:unnamed protein product [Lepeophtheirus salmonis]CAF3000591.1 unnamed protein product [Lepeophtheirus salmonis]
MSSQLHLLRLCGGPILLEDEECDDVVSCIQAALTFLSATKVMARGQPLQGWSSRPSSRSTRSLRRVDYVFSYPVSLATSVGVNPERKRLAISNRFPNIF